MKQNKRGLTMAILSISLLTVMAGAAMAPALGAIRDHFCECSQMTVQLIVSLPAFFIIVTTFLFRPLCRLFKTRTMTLVGLCMYLIAGAGAFFVDNIAWLLVLRALLGVSVGIIMPLSTGLLSYYYPADEQSHMMGLSAAMNQVGGVVATLLAGLLVARGWNYAFLVYLLGLFAIVLVACKLPNDSLSTDGKMVRPRNLLRFHPSVTAMLFIMILFFVYPTNFALTAHEVGLSTMATTLIMVGLDLVAFAVGLAFGCLMKTCRKQMKYMAPVLFLAGYASLSFVPEMGGMLAGSALIGLANGTGVPYVNTIASIKGGRNAALTVMPLISAALYLGQFISPIIVTPLATHLGCTPYHIAMGLSLLFLVQVFITRKHHALPPQ